MGSENDVILKKARNLALHFDIKINIRRKKKKVSSNMAKIFKILTIYESEDLHIYCL